MPSSTSSTGIFVALASRSGKMPSLLELKCWTTTKAIPVSVAKCLSSAVNASSPPAEAPMPATGKDFLCEDEGCFVGEVDCFCVGDFTETLADMFFLLDAASCLVFFFIEPA